MSARKKRALPAVIDRRTFIGSSDIAAIAGLSPWRSSFDCWVEKRGLIGEGPKPTGEGRDPLYFGKLLERVICEEYERRQKRKLVFLFDEARVHPDRSWQGGSPDAIDNGAGIVVDAKNVGLSAAHGFGESGTDEIPEYYLAQLSWLMSLLDFEGADLAVLIGGQELRVFSITRNRDLEDALLNIGEKWWREHVVADVPPIVTDSETARAYFRKRFGRETVEARPATAEEAELVGDLAEIRRLHSLYEKRKADVEATLKMQIGDAAGLIGDDFRISWKAAKDSISVDWEAAFTELRNEVAWQGEQCPDFDSIVQKYTTTRPGSRRFLPTFSGPRLLKGATEE